MSFIELLNNKYLLFVNNPLTVFSFVIPQWFQMKPK